MKCFRFLLIFVVLVLAYQNSYAQIADIGKRYIYYEKYNEAKVYYKNLIAIGKNLPENYYQLGKVYLETKNNDSAKACFMKATEADKEVLLGTVGMMGYNYAIKDNSNASKIYEEIIDKVKKKDTTTRVEAIYILANYAPATVIDDIKELVLKVKEYSKRNYEIYLSLANMYYKRSESTLAIENYKYANDYNSKNVISHAGIGKVYSNIKNYGAAEVEFNEAIKLDPTLPSVYKDLSEIKEVLKDNSKAADYYKLYLQYSESSNQKLKQYAILLYRAKRYQETVDVATEILTTDPKNADIQELQAYGLYEVGKIKECIISFERYFELKDNKNISGTAYEYYATLLKKDGKDSLAIVNFQNAINADTSKYSLYGEIGALNYKAKDYKRTVEAFENKELKTGKQLEPGEYFNQAISYYLIKDYTKADTTFGKVSALNPELTIAYLWRGKCNTPRDTTFELGLAKPHYEKFIEVASKDGAKFKKQLIEAYTYMGNYFMLNKEREAFKKDWKEKARSFFDKVLEVDPKNEPALEAIKGL